MQYHAIPCNTMQNHAKPCHTMQYHGISCNIMQYHAMQCNTLQYHAIPCNTMQYNAMPCYTMQYHAIPCNTRQYHAIQCTSMHGISWNIMQYHAIQCNDMLYHAISCNTMQYNAIPCNTMQYHACLITADGAYHCPVGSIWPFLYFSLFFCQSRAWPCLPPFIVWSPSSESLVPEIVRDERQNGTERVTEKNRRGEKAALKAHKSCHVAPGGKRRVKGFKNFFLRFRVYQNTALFSTFLHPPSPVRLPSQAWHPTLLDYLMV